MGLDIFFMMLHFFFKCHFPPLSWNNISSWKLPPYQFRPFLWTSKAFTEKKESQAADHPLNNEWNLTTNFPPHSEMALGKLWGQKAAYTIKSIILSILDGCDLRYFFYFSFWELFTLHSTHPLVSSQLGSASKL